jgi:hypothetical protein
MAVSATSIPAGCDLNLSNFVEDEIDRGDVGISSRVHSGHRPDVRERQDSDYLFWVFDFAMFASHAFLTFGVWDANQA